MPRIGSDNPLSDLAIDILGEFFRSESDRPFAVIFDFYTRHGIIDFENTDPETLYSLFLILLKGFIRKELAALSGQEEPQIANLKRRFKDILRDPRYSSQILLSLNADIIYLQANAENLRTDAQPIYYQDLLSIAEQAYLDSKTRQEWCTEIFKIIDRSIDLQNFVRRSDLLRAVIAVNAKYSEIEGLNLSRFPLPDIAILNEAAEKARAESLGKVRINVMSRFLEKGRITPAEADLFERAAERYLIDFGHDGSADSIPDYFREIMPESYQKEYLTRYKYVFENVISEAVEYFKEILRNDSTIRHLGRYYRNEKD